MIKPNLKRANRLLMEGAQALSQIEANGIRIDVEYLEKTIVAVGAEIDQLKAELRADKVWKLWERHFGGKAKLSSTQQLAVILYEVLGFPCYERTEKTKQPRLNERALEQIPLPFCEKYLRLRRLYKVKTTYLEGIRREVRDGFLHPFFNLHLTDTYRSSSDSPNFQNIPTRNKVMKKLIRPCFIPRSWKRRIVSNDYSGIEVRVAHCYHKDPVMEKYLRDKTTDMHRDMASEIYVLKHEQVSDDARHAAKNQFVFPEFYGSVYFQCAPALWESVHRQDMQVVGKNIPVKEHLARKGIKELGECDPDKLRASGGPEPGTFCHHVMMVEKDFWGRRFKVYNRWKQDWYEAYLMNGFFASFTGFVFRGAFRKNQVINYPVQGPAFHCLLQSMIWMLKEMRKRKMQSLLIAQIHDDMLGDVVEEELQEYLGLAREIMTERLPKVWDWITIPLEVGTEVAPQGKSWYEKAKWHCKEGTWQLKV